MSANNCSEEDEDSVKLSEQITFRLDSFGKKVNIFMILHNLFDALS